MPRTAIPRLSPTPPPPRHHRHPTPPPAPAAPPPPPTRAPTSTASAHGNPNAPAISPTVNGPSPPASAAALLSVTATELRPGRLPYSRACRIGYHGAVAALSTARMSSLATGPGTSRKPG